MSPAKKEETAYSYAIDRARRVIAGKIAAALELEFNPDTDKPMLEGNLNDQLREPPPGIEAHFALPCFPFARLLRKSPVKIAEELAEKIPVEKDGYIEKLEPLMGYLNVTLNRSRMNREVFGDFDKYGDDYGNSADGKGMTVVIDYSSPNIAKPFSVGNIRSTIIGHAIYNIYKALGYNMVGDNHLGDWGTQFGKLIYAYRMWGDDEKIRENPIQELLSLYVRFHQEAEKDDETGRSMEEEARRYFKMLEDGDGEMTRIWKWFVDLSMQEFNNIYNRLGIRFDHALGESFYNDKTDEVVELIKEKGIGIQEEDGPFLVRLEEHGISTPLLVQKKDGATLYATRDLAGLLYRIREFKPHLIIYVVGSEQKLHFKQCFKTMELLGYDTRCAHVDFGLVSLPEGKMSTRKGRVIFFEDVMEEAVERIRKFLMENRPDLPQEEREKIAETVGIGAVVFNDLFQSRVNNIVFDWDTMLSLDGDTAPYLQYSYARVQSILRKSDTAGSFNPELLQEEEEFALVRKLAWFPEIIHNAAEGFSPHTIAQYLVETARVFTAFYNKIPVLKAGDDQLVKARLELLKIYAIVIRKGLEILGIRVLDRM